MSANGNGIHPQVRVFVRPYGSPVPLGFFAFGVGMFMYWSLDIGLVKATDGWSVGMLLVAFVAPLEFLSTIVAFLARDAAAATALGAFSMSWLVGGLELLTGKPGVLSPPAAYFYIAFTVIVLLLAVGSFVGKPLLALLLFVSSFRGIFGAVWQLGGGSGWERASGWVALVAFGFAMYGGIAFLLEDSFGRTVLPLARRAGSREAIEEPLAAQLQTLADEAGVRHTL